MKKSVLGTINVIVAIVIMSHLAFAIETSIGGSFEAQITEADLMQIGANVFSVGVKLNDTVDVLVDFKYSESSFASVVDAAVLKINKVTIGKQGMPFGTFTSRLLSDTFAKSVGETGSIGVVYRDQIDALSCGVAIFNACGYPTTKAIAGSAQITYELSKGISVGGSFIADNNGAAKQNISGMAEVAIDKATIDIEVFQGLTGANENQMIYNLGLAYQLMDNLEVAARYDGANDDAKAVVGKSGIAAGLNYAYSQYMTLSGEYTSITDAADSSTSTITGKLAVKF